MLSLRAVSDSLPSDPLNTLPELGPPVAQGGAQEGVRQALYVYGVTRQGKVFRPSDWAERLCGVMAPYRPGGAAGGRHAHMGYSPYVRPIRLPLAQGGFSCVVVDPRLQDLEPMAYEFVLHFARDNDLPVYPASELPQGQPL